MRQRYGIEGSLFPISVRPDNEYVHSIEFAVQRTGNKVGKRADAPGSLPVGFHKQPKRSVSKAHEPSSYRHLLSPETRMRLEEWEVKQRG